MSIDDLITPLTKEQVLADMLSVAGAVGLDTSFWQVDTPELVVFTIIAEAITVSGGGGLISTIASGGFLDLAAGVTPEGGPGWLDRLASSVYQVTRVPATNANTTEVLTAVGAAGGTFVAGGLHFLAGEFIYTNTAPFTLPSTGTVSVAVQSDVAGSAPSAGAGAINALLTPIIGVTVTNPGPAIGADAESNTALVQRCRDRLAALSVDGPAGAYDYNARTINGPNQVAVVSGSLTQPAEPVTKTKVVVNASTGTVTTYVAGAIGAYATPPNYTQQLTKAIVSSTNASPISVTVTAHGYVTGDQVFIAGHLVDTNANGSWVITVTGANTFTLYGSTGNGVGGATGTAYRYSDLDLVDKSIQANAVPLSVTATTLSASQTVVSVVATVTVTGSASALSDTQITAKVSTALAELGAVLPIGGQPGGFLYLETVRKTIYDSLTGIINVVMSVPNIDVVVSDSQIVVFGAPTLTVVRL